MEEFFSSFCVARVCQHQLAGLSCLYRVRTRSYDAVKTILLFSVVRLSVSSDSTMAKLMFTMRASPSVFIQDNFANRPTYRNGVPQTMQQNG